MASINTIKKNESLSVFTVTGDLTRDDIIFYFEDWIKHDVTDLLIWDLRDADLSNLSKEDLEHISDITKTYANHRKNGKTALLVPVDLSFGISRMYEVIAEVGGHPIPIRAFRAMEDALAWLDE